MTDERNEGHAADAGEDVADAVRTASSGDGAAGPVPASDAKQSSARGTSPSKPTAKAGGAKKAAGTKPKPPAKGGADAKPNARSIAAKAAWARRKAEAERVAADEAAAKDGTVHSPQSSVSPGASGEAAVQSDSTVTPARDGARAAEGAPGVTTIDTDPAVSGHVGVRPQPAAGVVDHAADATAGGDPAAESHLVEEALRGLDDLRADHAASVADVPADSPADLHPVDDVSEAAPSGAGPLAETERAEAHAGPAVAAAPAAAANAATEHVPGEAVAAEDESAAEADEAPNDDESALETVGGDEAPADDPVDDESLHDEAAAAVADVGVPSDADDDAAAAAAAADDDLDTDDDLASEADADGDLSAQADGASAAAARPAILRGLPSAVKGRRPQHGRGGEPRKKKTPYTPPILPASADGAALVVRELTKHFGSHKAVDRVDLTVPTGAFYGIVGPNGAGKTTTLSMISGLLRADSGAVSVCGVDARKNSRAAKKLMGVLPDRFRTFDRLTGTQLLHYYGALRGLPSSVVDTRTADLARAFDLTDALSRVVSDYSAGMTKKVMLAGALIHSPRLLVLDEPFESVDPVSSAVILEILTAYVKGGGTVILSSHGMDLVERVCSRVAVIVSGQVLAEGTVDEVRQGMSLEQRFVELSGGLSEVEGLEWLHTYSG